MEVEQTVLPGIGHRHDFATRSGRRIGVVTHRTGRLDLLIYDANDPDTCSESVELTREEADTLAELLGAPRMVERLAELRRQAEGLVSEQVPVPADSPYIGRTLADTEARKRTGASIVAVVRRGEVHVSPPPSFRLQAGDGLVVVGTAEGTAALAQLLRDG